MPKNPLGFHIEPFLLRVYMLLFHCYCYLLSFIHCTHKFLGTFCTLVMWNKLNWIELNWIDTSPINHRKEQSKHKVLPIDEWCVWDDVTQPDRSISLFSGQYHSSAVNITLYISTCLVMCRYSVMWRGVHTCTSLYIVWVVMYCQTYIHYFWYNPNLCHMYIIIHSNCLCHNVYWSIVDANWNKLIDWLIDFKILLWRNQTAKRKRRENGINNQLVWTQCVDLIWRQFIVCFYQFHDGPSRIPSFQCSGFHASQSQTGIEC